MTGANALDESCGGWIGWDTASQKISVQRRVGQVENRLETCDFGGGERRGACLDETLQHGVELAHSAAAPPAQPSQPSFHAR